MAEPSVPQVSIEKATKILTETRAAWVAAFAALRPSFEKCAEAIRALGPPVRRLNAIEALDQVYPFQGFRDRRIARKWARRTGLRFWKRGKHYRFPIHGHEWRWP